MTQEQNETTERARARVGQTLRGKWRLDRLLGVGGMAAVYAATHRNGNVGAVKMLHPELSLNTQVRSRFAREGYVANKVGHPGAVAVLDDDVAEDGSVFLVMELLEGESLAARAARRAGRLAISEALTIADAVLDVLVAAHERGIVHRDLKPDNLFLTLRGELKVLDFGIARLQNAPEGPNTTASGSMLGTPAFLPPEQAQGEWHRVDARSDLWALGATLFSLITGRHVHQEPNVLKLMFSAMTQPAPPLATVLPDAPAPVCALVDRALAFDPENRWPDAQTMQIAVRDARADLGYSAASMAVVARSGPISFTSTLESDRGLAAPLAAQPSARAPEGSTSTTAPLSSDPAPAPPRRRRRWRIAALVALGAAWITTAALLAPGLISPTPAASTAPAVTSVPLPELMTTAAAPTSAERGDPAAPPSSASAAASTSASARGAGPRKTSPTEIVRPQSPPATAAPSATTTPSATAAPSATEPPGGNVASAIRDRK